MGEVKHYLCLAASYFGCWGCHDHHPKKTSCLSLGPPRSNPDTIVQLQVIYLGGAKSGREGGKWTREGKMAGGVYLMEPGTVISRWRAVP